MKEDLLKAIPELEEYEDVVNFNWYLGIGEGWKPLFKEALLKCLLIAKKKRIEFKVLQVKEKFGGLRFYFRPHNEEFLTIAKAAEALSFKVCEDCGAEGERDDDSLWIRTLCEGCKKERNS